MVAYHWERINDLPDNWRDLASSELEGLISVWKEQQARLEQLEGIKIFNERLRREWSIETGIIENLYSIDRGTTALLIDKGLEASLITHGATDKPAELVIAILRDQKEALEGLFDYISNKRPLSTSYIKQLHAELTRHQTTVTSIDSTGKVHEVELIRGDYKKWPNNPTRRRDELIHEYCPPEHVPSEMDRLVEMHNAHEKNTIPVEIEAAWLHHRFTQIHPFQDGNGRMARLLASLVFLRGYAFPLVIHRDMRDRYIDACETADVGNIVPMVALFTEIQKHTFVRALSISEDVLHDREPLRVMLAAVQDRMQAKQQKAKEDKQTVFETVSELENITYSKLQSVADELNPILTAINTDYQAFADASTNQNDFWFKSQIVTIAKRLQYYADTGMYRSWRRLKIKETRQIDILISFHSLGYEFTGVIAASAYIEYRQWTEDDNINIEGPYQLCDSVFQFAYTEDRKAVIARFSEWLDSAILAGLDQWRRSI